MREFRLHGEDLADSITIGLGHCDLKPLYLLGLMMLIQNVLDENVLHVVTVKLANKSQGLATFKKLEHEEVLWDPVILEKPS